MIFRYEPLSYHSYLCIHSVWPSSSWQHQVHPVQVLSYIQLHESWYESGGQSSQRVHLSPGDVPTKMLVNQIWLLQPIKHIHNIYYHVTFCFFFSSLSYLYSWLRNELLVTESYISN